MQVTGIGINGDGRRGRFHLDEAREDLTFFRRCGFDAVEIPVHQLDLIVGGRLRPDEVDKVRATLEAFDFVYTVHAPERLNLAFPQKDSHGQPELALEQDVFLACLDVCAAIEAIRCIKQLPSGRIRSGLSLQEGPNHSTDRRFIVGKINGAHPSLCARILLRSPF